MGKGSVFFKGLATGTLTMLLRVYWHYKLDLVFFYFFFILHLFWGRSGGCGVDLGGLGSEGDWGVLCEISK